jgi:hypothetical protein
MARIKIQDLGHTEELSQRQLRRMFGGLQLGTYRAVPVGIPLRVFGESSDQPTTEADSFVFGKIEWTYEDGGVSFIDDWHNPTV